MTRRSARPAARPRPAATTASTPPGAADRALELGLRRHAETGGGRGLRCFVAHLRSAFAASRIGSPAFTRSRGPEPCRRRRPRRTPARSRVSVFSVVPSRMSASACVERLEVALAEACSAPSPRCRRCRRPCSTRADSSPPGRGSCHDELVGAIGGLDEARGGGRVARSRTSCVTMYGSITEVWPIARRTRPRSSPCR